MIPKTLPTVLLTIVMFFAAGSVSAQTKWERIASFPFEWDGHNVQVVLEICTPREGPGDFTRIRILSQGRKKFVLINKEGWVKYGSAEASASPEIRHATNTIRSPYLLAFKIAESRTAIFLFGYSYASSPGSIDVLELSPDGQPVLVLHRGELGLKEVRDLDGDGAAEIVGYPCLSEKFGNGLLTYDPFNVYQIGSDTVSQAVLSVPLSKSYNLTHYYGWAGARCRDDIAVVLHPGRGGKPRLMSTKEAEKLTRAEPK